MTCHLTRLNLLRIAPLALALSSVTAVVLVSAIPAQAQFGGAQSAPTTQVHDPSVIKPPAGAKVAIIEFEDMECPDCARANPLLRQAVAKYNIPWVRHDFPLSFHAWSFQAAVNARWFDTKSKKLGDDYRDAVFANQPSITTLAVLRTFTEKFASDHGVGLPFAVDPQGQLTGLVKADQATGERVGIDHTPTIWVAVSGAKGGPPYVEVVDRTKLYQIIDAALAETRASK